MHLFPAPDWVGSESFTHVYTTSQEHLTGNGSTEAKWLLIKYRDPSSPWLPNKPSMSCPQSKSWKRPAYLLSLGIHISLQETDWWPSRAIPMFKGREYSHKVTSKLDMVAHTCNPSTGKAVLWLSFGGFPGHIATTRATKATEQDS